MTCFLRCACFFAALASSSAYAARWYTFELFVFCDDKAHAQMHDKRFLLTMPEDLPKVSAIHLAPPQKELGCWQKAPTRHHLFKASKKRLLQQPGMREVMHLRWLQPYFAPGANYPVFLSGGPMHPCPENLMSLLLPMAGLEPERPQSIPEFFGWIQVDIQKFLEIKLDLYGLAQNEGAPSPSLYRIHHEKKVRSGEWHYLDHPWIGIFLRFDKAEDPGLYATLLNPSAPA